jgi:hypothetical protein
MNGRPEWLEELKDARREGLDEWEHIGTSRDLRLTGEQKHNSQAVDMAIAQRAEVSIGNGVRQLAFFCCWAVPQLPCHGLPPRLLRFPAIKSFLIVL